MKDPNKITILDNILSSVTNSNFKATGAKVFHLRLNSVLFFHTAPGKIISCNDTVSCVNKDDDDEDDDVVWIAEQGLD